MDPYGVDPNLPEEYQSVPGDTSLAIRGAKYGSVLRSPRRGQDGSAEKAELESLIDNLNTGWAY